MDITRTHLTMVARSQRTSPGNDSRPNPQMIGGHAAKLDTRNQIIESI